MVGINQVLKVLNVPIELFWMMSKVNLLGMQLVSINTFGIIRNILTLSNLFFNFE